MEDIKILEAVERYILGQMSPDERVYFEQLRKSNPEVDQAFILLVLGIFRVGIAKTGCDFLHGPLLHIKSFQQAFTGFAKSAHRLFHHQEVQSRD